MRAFILISFAVITFGCRTAIPVRQTSVIKDSVNTTEKESVHDSISYAPVDSASIRATVICPDGQSPVITKIIYRDGARAKVDMNLDGNNLTVKCDCDSVKLVNKILLREKSQTHVHTSDKSKEIPVKYIPKIYKYLSLFGGVCLIALACYIVAKIKGIA